MMGTAADLIPLLVEKTRLRKIPWQMDPANDQEVYFRLLDSQIEIDRYTDADDELKYRVCIRNDEGKLVEIESFPYGSPEGRALNDVFDTARRIILKIDETIDKLKDRLEKL